MPEKAKPLKYLLEEAKGYNSPIIVLEYVVGSQKDQWRTLFWRTLKQVEEPLDGTRTHRYLSALEAALHDVYHAFTQ